jgi:hypothetical protein
MSGAHRLPTEGGVFHLTHHCHIRAFLLKFARDRNAYRAKLREQLQEHALWLLDYGVIIGAQAGTSATRSQEKQLLSEQKILGDQRLGSCRPEEECAQDPEKVPKDRKSVVHGGYDVTWRGIRQAHRRPDLTNSPPTAPNPHGSTGTTGQASRIQPSNPAHSGFLASFIAGMCRRGESRRIPERNSDFLFLTKATTKASPETNQNTKHPKQ